MQQLLVIFHLLIALSLIALVMLQRGKGSEVGAAFGSGAANTMFGSQGSTPFLIKVTALLAALFFASSLGLGYLVNQQSKLDVVALAAKQVEQGASAKKEMGVMPSPQPSPAPTSEH